jgi:hypothetical protein
MDDDVVKVVVRRKGVKTDITGNVVADWLASLDGDMARHWQPKDLPHCVRENFMDDWETFIDELPGEPGDDGDYQYQSWKDNQDARD